MFSPWGNNTTRANYYIFVCPLCCNTIRTECNFLKGFPWDKKVPLFPIFIVQPCLNVYGGIFGWWWDNSCKLLPSLKVQISHRDRLCLRQLIKYFFRVRKEIGWQFDRDFKQFHGLQYLAIVPLGINHQNICGKLLANSSSSPSCSLSHNFSGAL